MADINLLRQLEQLIPAVTDKILQPLFNQTTAQTKTDGSIVTEADLAMQDALTSGLLNIAPSVKMLGEEMLPAQQQQVISSDAAYWCLDPVDGTNNFHHGVPLFAVSLALIEKQDLKIGIVYDPVRKETFSALKGHGLWINGQQYSAHDQPESLNTCLASVDFKRLNSPMKQRLCQKMPFKSQRNIGTCALEWAWLAAGRTQLLLHGGEKLWDYTAGSLLLSEAGGQSCTDTYQPVFNNSLDNRPVIAAVNSNLHELWANFLLTDAVS